MQNAVGQRIKELRGVLNMSQQQFVDSLGIEDIDQTKLSRIEVGTTKKVSELLLKQICKIHSVSEQWLLKGSGEMLELPAQESAVAQNMSGQTIVNFTATVNRLLDDVEAWRKESETWRGLYLSLQKSASP